MRTPVTRFEKLTGAFLVATGLLLVVALAGAFRRQRFSDLFAEQFIVSAVADDAYGTAVGSPVKLHDVEIGSVQAVELDEEPAHPGKSVKIRMAIQPRAARFLRDRTIARILRAPFGSGMPPFGTSSIELVAEGTAQLAPNATIEALGEESLIATMLSMRRDFEGLRDKATPMLDRLSAALDDVHVITTAIARGDGFAGRMLNDARTADDLSSMLRDAKSVTGDLKGMTAALKVAVAKAPALAEGAEETSREVQKTLARVNALLETMPRIVATMDRTLAAAEELTANLRTASTAAPDLARKVDVSIDETNRLVEAAQRNFLLRATLPDRPTPRTEAEVRPSAALGDGGLP